MLGAVIQNSETIGWIAVSVVSSPSVVIDNPLLLCLMAIVVLPQMNSYGSIEIKNSIVIGECLLHFNIGRFMLNPGTSSRLKVSARRNVIDTSHTLVTISQLGVGPNLMTLDEVRSIPLLSLLLYGGHANRYDIRWPVVYLNPREDPVSLTQLVPFSLQEWSEYGPGKDRQSRTVQFNPAVGFDGYHPDLLRISGAKELRPSS